MSLSENPVLTGAGWRVTGSEAEGGIGHGGGSTAKVAEAGC